jgi:glycosyltransferase involved in cell wall biosynthesis
MTLGIDISRLASKQKTGVEWYVYFLIRELRDIIPSDVEVRLYTLDEPIIDVELPSNFVIHRLSWRPRRLWTQLRLSWEMLVHPPDILFVPSHVIPFIHPKRTVTTIHDIAGLRFPQAYNWFERWYTLYAARQAVELPAVLTPSQYTKDELIDYLDTPGKNIHVTPLGFERDETVASVELSEYGITKPFLLSVGRIEEKKNQTRIVQAFDLLKQDEQFVDLQLALVGKPGYGYERVEEAIEASPNKHNIIRPNWLAPDTLQSLYSQAELFVFPSLYEGFGIPILEAFAAGTPVLTSSGTSTEEVGGEGALYVDPESVEAIAAGMRVLLTNESLREQNIRQGRDRALHYSWHKTAEETWNVINRYVYGVS